MIEKTQTDTNSSSSLFLTGTILLANMDYTGLVRTGEDQVNSAMYKAARANGVQYYDLRADSIGHGMCAPDSSRWISGKWEYSVPHNLFNHLTHLGNRNVAQLLNSKVLAH